MVVLLKRTIMALFQANVGSDKQTRFYWKVLVNTSHRTIFQ